MKFRAFLIGYGPPGWYDASGHIADVGKAQRLMAESDFAAIALTGIPLGQRISTEILSAPPTRPAPPSGTLVCVGHEHGGKVVILSDEAENSA